MGKKINKDGKLLAYTASSPVFHVDGIHQHKSDPEDQKNP